MVLLQVLAVVCHKCQYEVFVQISHDRNSGERVYLKLMRRKNNYSVHLHVQ